MKTTKILYWVFTVLLVALMLFSAIGTFLPNPQGDAFAASLGYQPYIFKFLAVAKILGIIAILVPGNARLKEWAYAGFAFDMLGAIYSFIVKGFPASQWAPFLIGGLIFLFGSYICYHKLKAPQV